MFITADEILSFLQSVRSEKQVILHTKTLFKMLRKDKQGNANPFGDVFRVAASKVTLGKQYSDRVNEQRAAEHQSTDFEANPRKWGIRNGVFVEKGDELYVSAVFDESISSMYIDEKGNPLKYEDLAPFVSTAKSVVKAKENIAKHQGVDEAVQYRVYKMSSVQAIATID